jgi:hypothetical protein
MVAYRIIERVKYELIMNGRETQLNVGQRVRIIEEEDPPVHLGKMAVVERVEISTEGDPICVIRIDRFPELVTIPQRYLKPITTISSTLFSNDLSLPWDPEPKERIDKFTDNNWLAAHILENLLFYNQVIVPTVDFSIVVPLVHWLGVPLFKELLEAQAIIFVRTSGSLAYIGNGVGLAMIEIRPPKEIEEKEPWWVKVHRCSPKEAVTLQLRNRLLGLNEGLIDLLAKLVELCTVDTALPQFNEKVMNETYRDIQGSRVLADYLFDRNPSILTIALNRLPGIEPNQVRMFTSAPKPAVAGDEVDICLRLAMLNLEAYMADEAGARDMVTDRSYHQLLSAKAQRYTGGRIARESFSKLLTVEEIPDIVSAIMSGEVNLPKVWQFRNTKVANEFRQWFDQVGPTNPDILTSEYIKSLKAGGFLSGGKGKTLRFIVLQAIGASLIPMTSAISFIASMGLNAVDCFLLDKVRLGFRPRYFVDDLRTLFPKHDNSNN